MNNQQDLQAKLANYINIPLELRQLNQWGAWHYEDIGAKKPTKVPHFSTTDPATWITFEQAISYVAHGKADGIGFVFSENDPFAGIDLDEVNGDWLATERQQKIYKEFISYSERSPSGQGLHIIVKGSIPIGRKRSCIEIYSSKRYFTFTGDVYRDAPINDCQELLTTLWEQMGSGVPKVLNFTGDKNEKESDEEVIKKASNANNADKFIELYKGEWRNIYPSQSEADYALIDIIAFYTQNRTQIKRIFRSSNLGQRDKAKRDDYLERMILNSFDKMLPQIDLDGLNIAIEKVLNDKTKSITNKNILNNFNNYSDDISSSLEKGSVAQRLVPAAHNGSDAGSNPAASTNLAASFNGRTTPFEGVNIGSNPIAASKPSIDLPPGLLGEIAQFIYQAAPRPVPEIAIAGAIGLMAGIAGRAYNVSSTGLNQYVLLLAKTGRGKEAMASGINKLINAIKLQVPTVTNFLGPDEIASGPALYRFLAEQKSFVSILSEFGLRLMQMADAEGSSPSVSLRRMYLQLYAKSGFTDVANPSIYSDKDRNVAAIESPAFSILGESTPHTFYNNLSEEMISEGLLPRFLVIEYDGPRPPLNVSHAEAVPSFSLIEKLVAMAANAQTVQNASPRKVIKVEFDNQSRTIADAYDRQCDRIINDEKSNTAVIELWNRAQLKVLKLSACVAIGVNPYQPIINAEHINWAIDMVGRDIDALTKRFEGGDVGTNTSEIKQIDLITRISKEYLISPFENMMKYLDKDEKSKILHQHKVIPYSFISRRTIAQAPFKNDRRGATDALKRCLQVMTDRDSFRELAKHEMKERFGSTQRAFMVSDVNILK